MSKNKMSKLIRDILEVTDSVLDRPATRMQVIQVIELIESFNVPEKPVIGNLKASTVQTKPKAKAVKKRRRYTSPKVVVNWSELQWWCDEVLDGKTNQISFQDLSAILPIEQMRFEAMQNHLRIEAKRRGWKTAHITKNKKLGFVSIQAITK